MGTVVFEYSGNLSFHVIEIANRIAHKADSEEEAWDLLYSITEEEEENIEGIIKVIKENGFFIET